MVTFATLKSDIILIIRRSYKLKELVFRVRSSARVRARSFVNVGTTAPELESTQRLIIPERFALSREVAQPVKSSDPDVRRRRPRYWSIDLAGWDNALAESRFRRRRNRSVPRRVWPVGPNPYQELDR